MNSALYVAYSALRADMQALDVVANNVANINTNGFREERSFVESLEIAGQSFPQVGGTREKPQPGPLVATGRPLDVAVEGSAFLVVETDRGRRYTRDGGLSLDATSTLVNREGWPVLGQGGRITLSPGVVEIDPDGRVTAGGAQAGRLLLVSFDSEALEREASGLYRAVEGRTEAPATDARLRQGFVEKSNVKLPASDIGALRRHFQSLSQAMTTVSALERRLITTVRGA